MSKNDVREVEQLMRDLGYTAARNNGHTTYTHAEQPNLTLAGTPSDRRWRANVMAELARRHPELRPKKALGEKREARRQREAKRRETLRDAKEREAAEPRGITFAPSPTPEERRRMTPRPSVAVRLGIEVVSHMGVPNPGSPEAVDLGCSCPVFRNNGGAGVDGQPNTFVYLLGCPVHDEDLVLESPPAEVAEQRRCECGNPLPAKTTGRPRKWCRACRPSRWDRLTEEERERRRGDVRRWYARHVKKETP